MVQLIFVLIFTFNVTWGRTDRAHAEIYLGEKNLDSYASRWDPWISFDFYQGKLAFSDDLFLNNYFQGYLFTQEKEVSSFFKSELKSGLLCSNEDFSKHFDDLRYAYRLITLSYLLEAQWHLDMVSKTFLMKHGCSYKFEHWLKSCSPRTPEMKKFLSLLERHKPKYEESLPRSYTRQKWISDLSSKNFKYFSHYLLQSRCHGNCDDKDIESQFKNSCEQNEKLMTLICSEVDNIYGLSTIPDAYQLIAQSNIINTFNDHGEALGCLRKFSTVMEHKEVKYSSLQNLFPALREQLNRQYHQRFIQGRVFFYGAGKEFEDKGLTNLHVMEQPLKIAELNSDDLSTLTQRPVPVMNQTTAPVLPLSEKPMLKKVEVVPKIVPLKSAFLQAAEILKGQNLERVEVDMTKLKYDFVFSLKMINTLSQKLQTFMTRDALKEMKAFDKLGTADGPVPLLFIKYMIDMQEHAGLFNVLSVLGDEFYVSNEIDEKFTTVPEKIKLINSDQTGGQWQILILKP